ncbi:MAG: sialate O-acetylesterase [Planctomycetota bacterium]
MLRGMGLGWIFVICTAAVTQAEPLRLPAIISDHLVLQRERFVPIWGWAAPWASVSVVPEWKAPKATAVADENGKWTAWIRTPAAGGPYSMTVSSRDEVMIVRDILIGEVWLCSGQSNMEMTVADTAPGYRGVLDWESEVASARHPRIRRIDIPNKVAITPQDDCEAEWLACTPETAGDFSATAYFFAREVQETTGVPIGLISADWGGTVAEAWTSVQGMSTLEDFAETMKDIARERDDAGALEKEQAEREADWWSALDEKEPGEKTREWADAADIGEGWRAHDLPWSWDGPLADHDGIVWFRHRFELSKDQANRRAILRLGPIDDMDSVWVNGTKVGGLEKPNVWTTPREYELPLVVLRNGENEIAVRVVDTGGHGGLVGPAEQMHLALEGADPISLTGEWHWKQGITMGELPRWPSVRRFNRDSPTALFNGQIAPVAPYGIRGAIWYQGESNRPRAAQYRRLLPAMIRDWRRVFGQGDFPFGIVQIAPYAYGNDQGQAAELREAQLLTTQLPSTGLAVTMDIGNARDIHPKNKQEVGRRLALWALNQVYGHSDIVYSGPVYRAMETEKESIRLRFDHVAGGLVCRRDALTHFTIAGSDREFHPAQAKIDGETIVVWSEDVAEPVAVRFAWGPADEPNLFNAAGLPASSFRTDDWPMLTQ